MPWDVLLASTLASGRIIRVPKMSWSSSTCSSLMPLRFDGGLWWVRARLVTKIAEPGRALDTISGSVLHDDVRDRVAGQSS
jgi:hypothetical protein